MPAIRESLSCLGLASLLVATLAVTSSPVSAAAQSASPDGDAGERRSDRALHRILVHRLVFVSTRGSGTADLWILDLGSGEVRSLTEGPGGGFRPSWSSDGERIAIGVGSFFQMRDEPARVVSVRADGSETRELTEAPPNSGFPSYSPDGSRIVYRVWGGGQRGLRILDLQDGNVTELTRGYDNFPAWSPTGGRIAFTRSVEGDFDIHTVRPDGSELTRLTAAPGNDAHPAWSPDGEHLLFSSSRLGFRDEAPLYDGVPQPYGKLFVTEADGSDPRPITDGRWEEGTPAWDPRPGEKP